MNANDKSQQAKYWVEYPSRCAYTNHLADQMSVIYDVEEKPLEKLLS